MPNNDDRQKSALAGELFVAAELLKRNYQVSLTFGTAKAIDLFVYNEDIDHTYLMFRSRRYENQIVISLTHQK